MCPTGLGEITQGYCEVNTHVCLIGWQNFTVRKPTQKKFWWNVYSYYRTWVLIYKVYCKYILCIENIVNTSWVTFSFNQLWRHRLRHIIVRNLSINTVLTSPSPKLPLQKEGFIFRPFIKIHGYLCKMSNFVKFVITLSRFKKCPCNLYSNLLSLKFASNTQFMYIYELMITMDNKYSKVGMNTLACRLCSKWCQTFGGRCMYERLVDCIRMSCNIFHYNRILTLFGARYILSSQWVHN